MKGKEYRIIANRSVPPYAYFCAVNVPWIMDDFEDKIVLNPDGTVALPSVKSYTPDYYHFFVAPLIGMSGARMYVGNELLWEIVAFNNNLRTEIHLTAKVADFTSLEFAVMLEIFLSDKRWGPMGEITDTMAKLMLNSEELWELTCKLRDLPIMDKITVTEGPCFA